MSEPRTDTSDMSNWVQVESAKHYDPQSYMTPWRMAAFAYQMQYVHRYFRGKTLLEVGMGSGLVAALLRQQGYKLSTLDVDERLKPDLLGSVTQIPAENQAFDAFICCQVLEHIKWELVEPALRELHRVSKMGGVISVPTNLPTFLWLHYNAYKWTPKRITLGSRTNKPIRNPNGEHHWELESNVTTKMFREKVTAAGFKILREYQPMECMYHQFMVVTKE